MNTPAKPIDDSPREAIRRVLAATGLADDVAAGYADLVCREFSGSKVYFVLREWRDLRERDQRIREENRAGRSITWLSQQYCLSRTQVHRIVSNSEA